MQCCSPIVGSDFGADDMDSSDSDDDYCEEDDDSDFDGGGKKRKRNITSTQKPAAAKSSKETKKTTVPKTAKATNKSMSLCFTVSFMYRHSKFGPTLPIVVI